MSRVFSAIAPFLVATLGARAGVDLSYPDFASPTGLNFVGIAAPVDGAARLTDAAAWRRGALWYSERVRLVDGFDTTFRFRVSGGDGADGLAFLMQGASAGAIGLPGGGLGYASITPSLAVEFDTWQNREPGYEEPSASQVSLQPNGLQAQSASLGSAAPAFAIDDGAVHVARISYHDGVLRVYVDCEPLLAAPIDLTNVNGVSVLDEAGSAFIGFTAATGGVVDAHEILSWSFTTGCAPVVTCQSGDQQVCLGRAFTLRVTGEALGKTSYQWRRSGVPIAGADQPVLEVQSAACTSAGTYDCVLTSECGATVSAPMRVAMCIADFNCDGATGSEDFFAFLSAFFTEETAADINCDAGLDSQDFFDFLVAFLTGC